MKTIDKSIEEVLISWATVGIVLGILVIMVLYFTVLSPCERLVRDVTPKQLAECGVTAGGEATPTNKTK